MFANSDKQARAYLNSVGLLEVLCEFELSVKHRVESLVEPSPDDIPIAISYIDLARLHKLITTRKVINILELGSGFSSIVLAHALKMNSERHYLKVQSSLRRKNPWHLDSVDESKFWSLASKARVPKDIIDYVSFYVRKVNISTFRDLPVTFYQDLPNRDYDLVYVDGPSLYGSDKSDWLGFNTNHPGRMPISADASRIEYFLQPGSMVLFDGRKTNANFFKNNVQQRWKELHSSKFDQTLFVNQSNSLGKFNSAFLEYWGKIEF